MANKLVHKYVSSVAWRGGGGSEKMWIYESKFD